jgi:hypothetical protein
MLGFSAIENLRPLAQQKATRGLEAAHNGDTEALNKVMADALHALLSERAEEQGGDKSKWQQPSSASVDDLEGLASLLHWQQPHLLLRYLAIHRNDLVVHDTASRLVRALLNGGHHGKSFFCSCECLSELLLLLTSPLPHISSRLRMLSKLPI